MTILVVSTSTFRFSLNTKRSVVKLFSKSNGEWSRSRAGQEPACGPLPPKQIAVGGQIFLFSVVAFSLEVVGNATAYPLEA